MTAFMQKAVVPQNALFRIRTKQYQMKRSLKDIGKSALFRHRQVSADITAKITESAKAMTSPLVH